MLDNQINVKKARLLILGVTFKENCNDIRNTKVVNLINYLKKIVYQVDAFDPLVKKKIFKKNFNINLLEKPKNNHYDALILAVPHKKFLINNLKLINKFLNKNGIIFDLKGILKKNKNIHTL